MTTRAESKLAREYHQISAQETTHISLSYFMTRNQELLSILKVRVTLPVKLKLKYKRPNRLCITRAARNSLATDKPEALEFPIIELEFRSLGYSGGGETGEEPGEKTLGASTEPTTNSTHI